MDVFVTTVYRVHSQINNQYLSKHFIEIYLDRARGMDPGARVSATAGRVESSGSVIDDGRHEREPNAERPIA